MSKKNVISFFPTLEPRVIKKTIDKKTGIGRYPVSLIVYFNGKRRRYRTNNVLTKKEWNKINGDKLRDVSLKDIKAEIDGNVARANDVKKNIENDKMDFSFDEFEKRYFNKIKPDISQITFSECMQEFIRNYKKDHKGKGLSIKSIIMYETVKNSLCGFNRNIRIHKITPEFLSDYESYLREKENSVSTIGIYLRLIRVIINYAIFKNYLPVDKYPFKNYNVPTAENKKRALSNDEIKALVYYKAQNEQEQKAVDFWTFSYLGNGINFNDIGRLRYNNIQGDFIHFVRTKTKDKQKVIREIEIFILPEMKDIIVKYGNDKSTGKDFIFPIINDTMNPIQQFKAIGQFIKTTNKYLKRVSSTLNFDFPVTTYWARHSWATKLRNSGVPISFICEGLGHSSIATTENYLSKFPVDDAKKFAGKLLDF